MRKLRSILPALGRIILAVASLAGCCGVGYCEVLNYDRGLGKLSHRDSIIQEMVCFIQPDIKLTKTERRHVENRINKFSHKIIRRDTTSFFVDAAYAIAFYEFYKHDYKKAMKWVNRFSDNVKSVNQYLFIFRFYSVGMGASLSINSKGKFKSKKDPNSWWVPIKLFGKSFDLDVQRTPFYFIDSFLNDVPLDCSITTYERLLNYFKDNGGRLELLNGLLAPGFVQRCMDADRNDILDIIFKLWNVKISDFTPGYNGSLCYINKKLKVDSVAMEETKKFMLSFDPDQNRTQLDSLILIGETSEIGNKVLTLTELLYRQYRYHDVIEVYNNYKDNCSLSQLSTLHNYYGLALLKLGRNTEALNLFDKAISLATNPDMISVQRINKACALAAIGRSIEAISIMMSVKENQKTAFNHFTWNDNLGYIYSFLDPQTALYYYEQAEKYLDGSTLYKDFKVRHFCRKAQVLTHNPYLRRQAIENALKLTRTDCRYSVEEGIALTELGVYHASNLDYEEADKIFSQAKRSLNRLSPNDIRMVYFNLNYAWSLFKLNRYDESIRMLINQFRMQNQIPGINNYDYFRTLRILIIVLCKHPVPGFSVDDLYREYSALRINNGFANYTYDDVIVDMAYCEYRKEWSAELKLIENVLKEEKLTTSQRLDLYSTYETMCRENLNNDAYCNVFNKLVPQIKTDIVNGLLTLSSGEQRTIQSPLDEIVNGNLRAKDYEDALQLSLFRKGLLFSSRKVIEEKFAKGRKTKKRYQTLLDQRIQLNNAIEYNDTFRISVLKPSVYDLERELSQSIASDKDIYRLVDKNLDMVTSRLKKDDLAIDFIKFNKEDSLWYGAFLIDSKGLIDFVVLGEESEIQTHPNRIWGLFKLNLARFSNVYFSPDGILNNIGIEFMQPSEYEVEDAHPRFHRVFHLSDIKSDTGIGDNVVAIGVSDHNSPVGKGETLDRGSWTDLPEVKTEMQLISRNLDSRSPRIIFNDEASEDNVKKLSGTDISTLHISSHGFFRNYEMLNEAASDTASCDFNIARRFLSAGLSDLSGIVLRRGNLSWRAPEILEEEDDILTAEEIETMSFPNLRLTVLSACDTGLGKYDSEGVWGLQRAFRIAGSQSLICSLRKVDDYWTAQFMDVFYEHAARGETIYDSFHAAQRWLYSEQPDNPEIWASFILIE